MVFQKLQVDSCPPTPEAAAAFLARMQPFMLNGLSFEAAGKAVLSRDKELMSLALADDEQGEALRAELAAEVYEKVKG